MTHVTELNGRPATPEELRALALTNYGHFTTLRVEDGRVRGLDLHLRRLAQDCATVFGVPLDTDLTRTRIRRAVGGRPGPVMARVTVFDPALDIGRPAAPGTPHVLVTTRPAGALPAPPLRLRSTAYVRDLPAVKHTGLFGALHARRAAQLAGYDDALFHGPDDHVSEGPTWNIGFVDHTGTVVWPAAPVLPGVTMTLLQRHHAHTTAPIPLPAAHRMRAAFATGTGIGVRAIAALDDNPLAPDDPALTTLRTTHHAIPQDPL
ncbi:aminotransferase class IV family protein [Streptomyces sp. NPDC047928]|uniref:aminotransferase class IV family protein n=1 Tax=unclassified Streptomyces TaxID=2593676 RepID=UPI003711A6FE